MGTLEMGSLYDNSFAAKETHSGNLKAPPPQPPLALVCCSVANSSDVYILFHIYMFNSLIFYLF